MSTVISPAINRRSLLSGAASAAAAASFPAAASDSSIANELRLVAAPARWPLVGKPNPSTDVWTYGNRLPGPKIRLRQGEPVRIVVENKLEQDTTVHWHGIRLPNDMDGVPGLTQAPIKPGQKFTYEFTPPDAGTFWYHPHANSLQQLGRGMAGALIVDGPSLLLSIAILFGYSRIGGLRRTRRSRPDLAAPWTRPCQAVSAIR